MMLRSPHFIPFHREELQVSDYGGTLLIKLCGFIQDERASLVSVDEDHLELRVGAARWRWLGFAPQFRLRLEFEPQADRSRRTAVQVALDSNAPHSADAHAAGWKLMYRLRSHLIANW
jgi:hypothetical protein